MAKLRSESGLTDEQRNAIPEYRLDPAAAKASLDYLQGALEQMFHYGALHYDSTHPYYATFKGEYRSFCVFLGMPYKSPETVKILGIPAAVQPTPMLPPGLGVWVPR